MANENKEKCFIITPIGEDNDPIRRHIDGIIDAAIKPALSDKYEVQAAHHISKPGSITKQVIEAIYNAKLVVANLTGRNPNVMYELALRHAIGKPVIMIVERGTPVPSDIIMQRVILYSNDAKGVLELRDDLKKAESEIVFEEKGGPIVEVLGDISHDVGNPEKVENTDICIQDTIAFILQRLDKIERYSVMEPKTQSIAGNFGHKSNQKVTVNVTAKMFDDIKTAVSIYRTATADLSAELEELIYGLVGTDFVGAAATSFVEFYTTNIKPANGEGLTSLLNAIDHIADAAKEATLGLDDQLADANSQIAKQ
jgi:hypothetical protein